MYIVSSCLCGNECRYNGKSANICKYPKIKHLLLHGLAVPICPEVLGGLSIPRWPAEIRAGTGFHVLQQKTKVLDIRGEDVTNNYVQGAWKTLMIAKQAGCNKAILKEKSPACGVSKIYDGNFDKTLIRGEGVLTALLKSHGFTVISDEELAK